MLLSCAGCIQVFVISADRSFGSRAASHCGGGNGSLAVLLSCAGYMRVFVVCAGLCGVCGWGFRLFAGVLLCAVSGPAVANVGGGLSPPVVLLAGPVGRRWEIPRWVKASSLLLTPTLRIVLLIIYH